MTLLVVSAGLRHAFGAEWLDQFNQNRTEQELLGEIIRNDDFCVISNKPLLQHQDTRWYFDGYAFLDERLVHPKLAAVAAGEIARIYENRADLSGVFVTGCIDEEKSKFDITSDMLGQYPIFLYRTGREFIVSNDLNLIRVALLQCGHSATPNPAAVALSAVWGTAFAPDTILREVRLLEPGASVRFAPGDGATVHLSGMRQAFATQYSNYSEALSDVTERLRSRCAAVINDVDPGWNRLVDVSGGVDSRITLAGFLGTGSATEMTYHGLGGNSPHKMANRQVSDNLLRMFGLPLGTVVIGNSAARHSGPFTRTQGEYRYYGMKKQGFTEFGELRVDDYCRVSGYFGECTKAHGSPLIRGRRPSATAEETVRKILDRVPLQAIAITEAGAAEVRRKMVDYYKALMEEVPVDKVNQFVYFEQKSRYHFGLNTSVANKFRVQIAPLLDPKIICATNMLPYRKLKANQLGFDMIHTLGGPELAYAPFADYQWDAKLKRDKSIPLPPPHSAESPALCEPLEGIRKVELGEGPLLQHEIEADFLTPSFRQKLAPFDGVISRDDQFLIALADRIPDDDDIWQLLDRTYFTPENLAVPIGREVKSKKAVRETRKGIGAMLAYYSGHAYAPPQSGSISGLVNR